MQSIRCRKSKQIFIATQLMQCVRNNGMFNLYIYLPFVFFAVFQRHSFTRRDVILLRAFYVRVSDYM